MSSKMMNGNISLEGEMTALVRERIRTRKYLNELEKVYNSEMEKVEIRAEWTKEAQELALCKKKLKKVRESRELVNTNIGCFLKSTENGMELLSPSDENLKTYTQLSKKLQNDVKEFNDSVSSAERIKKMEECIALVEELKIYRDQLINQKDALKPIRQNEQIEENILELAIAVQVLKLKVKLVQSVMNKDQME